jgi:signal transduction histidine kinase
MQVDSPWQAVRQTPRRLLASAWPWRSLAYLLGGIAPSLAVAAGLVAAITQADSQVAMLVLPPVALALLLSGPLVAHYERWRLRLVEPGRPPLDPQRRPEGAGRRALEVGYGVVSVLVLWLIDLAVVAVSLAVPAGMVLALLASKGTGAVVQAAMVAVGLLGLPLGAYPLTAWAGARSALARVILAPPDAELDQRLVEVTRSRARLVDAFELERRRIERDLHDGAQQRLVALTVALGLARLDLPTGSAAEEQVNAAHEQAKQALTELRELIRGVHPQVLTDRGLPAAIGDAAGRSPVTVEVDVVLQRRLPPAIEVAAYFAVCEALANIARHSRAGRASVRGWLAGGQLVLEVRDDGVGGADPAAGTGLAGLADRVAVVDGRLFLSSPAGGPTLVRVEIPCPKTVPSG